MTADPFVLMAAGLLGLVVGSFLNVCILRLPAGESVIRPGSHCPACERSLRWYENLPVISYLVLRGRCRGCGVRISLQYPLIELAVGIIWVGAFLYFVDIWQAISAATFLSILLGIAVTDARDYIIPDVFSLGGLGVGLALSLAPPPPTFVSSLLGAALGFALMYVVAVLGEWALKKPALGGGDIKMMAMVGAFLGPVGVLLTVFIGSLIGTIVFGAVRFGWKGKSFEGDTPLAELNRTFDDEFPDDDRSVDEFLRRELEDVPPEGATFILSGLLIEIQEVASGAVRRISVRRLVPFGVFLAAGAAIVMLWGGQLVDWYMRMVLGA